MGTKPPARIAQRISVNQTDVDRWECVTPGDDGPLVLAAGPMASHDWFLGMIRMAAAAAAAHLEPVEVTTRETPQSDDDAGDVETVPASGPAAVAAIVGPALEGLAAMREGAHRAGVELIDPAANPRP